MENKMILVVSLILLLSCDTKMQSIHFESGTLHFMFRASEFKRNVFFFLDTLYRNMYNKNYYLTRGKDPYVAPPKVLSLDVYIKQDISQIVEVTDSLLFAEASDGQMYYFCKLIPDKHYELFKNEGYIRFDTILNSFDMIAIYMRTEDGSIKRGNYGDTAVLWTLKPQTPIRKAEDDPERFYLMWRNVYDLDTNMLRNFELSIWREHEAEDRTLYAEDKSGVKRLISALLGLTTGDGKPLLDISQIYDVRHGNIIVPPYDNCPTCNEPFNNPLFGDYYRDSIIYRFDPESTEWSEHKSIYEFSTSGSK
jgi:hypothetical protein